MPITKIESTVNSHSSLVEKGLVAGLGCCAIVMFATLGCGIYLLGAAFVHVFTTKQGGTQLLGEILNALEIVFVSPLVYLLMLSLFKYISAVKPRVDQDLRKKTIYLDNAQLEILTVKSLSVSLFTSILILHALELILAGAMTTQMVLTIGIILLILIGYYWILDKLAGELKKRLDEQA